MPVVVVAGFAAIFVALFVATLAASWDTTMGPLLEQLAAAVGRVNLRVFGKTIVGLGFLAADILHLNASIRRTIGEAMAHVARPLVTLLTAATNVAIYPARELRALADDTAQTLWAIRRVVVPAFIAAKIGWISRSIATLAARVEALTLRAPLHIVHEITKVATKYATTVVNETIALPRPRIGRLEREAGALGKRVDRLARRVAPAALAAAVAGAIATSSLRWIRRPCLNKVSKGVCRIDPGLLDSLLADTALIVGTVSLAEFAKGLGEGMDTFTPQIRRFWHV